MNKLPNHGSKLDWLSRVSVRRKVYIDFDENFASVVKMSSIRVIIGLAASLDLEIEQMDIKTAFLHGDMDKEIYMEQPYGFRVKGKEDYVCKLKKSLYGLSQLWGSKVTRKQLLTIVYSFKGSLMMILSYYCRMWMTC